MAISLPTLCDRHSGRLPELVDEISPIGDQAAGSDARRASRLNGAGNHLLRLTNERYWTSQRSKRASSNSLPSELIWPGAPAIPSRALPLFGLASAAHRIGHRPLESIRLGSARRPLTTRQPFALRNQNEDRIAHVQREGKPSPCWVPPRFGGAFSWPSKSP
jgi:hypothetical protein